MTVRISVLVAFFLTLVATTSCNKNNTPDVQEIRDYQRVQPQNAESPDEMQQQMEQRQMQQQQMEQRRQMEQEPMGQEPMGQERKGQGQMGMMSQMRAGCPMVVRNAEVGLEQTSDGLALNFTTQYGDVEDLRRRVQQLGNMYEKNQGRHHVMWQQMTGEGQGRMMEGKGSSMADAERMPPVKANFEETDEGARIVLVPKDRKDLDTLRQRVIDHQQRMQSGQCFMLQEEQPGQQQQQEWQGQQKGQKQGQKKQRNKKQQQQKSY